MADENVRTPELSDEQKTERDTFGDNISKNIDLAIEAQDGPTETKTTPDPKADEEGTTKQPKDSASGDGDSNAQQQPTKEGQEETKQAHSPKDLKLADGTVVRGGAERRFYEQRETARERAKALETDLETVRREKQSFEDKFNNLQTTVSGLHGADPEQINIGLNIVRDLQRDPAGTMKKLLAEVVAQGYTVEGIGAGIDAQAIQRMIDERLPKQEQGKSEADETAEIEREVSSFYTTYPDAKPHDALLARVMRDNPGMELRTAYFQVKDAFAEKGFDWTRTLEENLGSSGLADKKDNPDTKTDTAPLPNGGNLNGSDVKVNKDNLAHEDMDTGDIVKQAMRESGLNI